MQTRLASRVLAPNPGPMTLDGTNTWVLREPGTVTSVIVDPGPDDGDHLDELEAEQPELIIVTHRHRDHTAGAAALADRTGASVVAIDPAECIGAEPLRDGERIEAADVRMRILATPGHTDDSLTIWLPDDRLRDTSATNGSMLTGDTILGRGTTVIMHPDGVLGEYLATLDRLHGFGAATVLPGHGAWLFDLAHACEQLREHRSQRLDEVRAALADLGQDATAEAVADVVYADVDASVRPAALASMRAQLAYLRR